ncbi:TPA: LuxR C-terminal-related transcriptional regulator [Serratia fonticola]
MNALVKEVKPVAIISQYALTRCGLIHFMMSLNEVYQVVFQAEYLANVIDSINKTPVDILVADLIGTHDSVSEQIGGLHQFHQTHPKTLVVVYTNVQDPRVLLFLKDIPQFSVISRQEPIDKIYGFIEMAISGEHIISPLVMKLISEFLHEDSLIIENLTRNENEVLSFYLKGMNLTQIAKIKNKSIKTVSSQKCSGMRKLGVVNDAELFLSKGDMLFNYEISQ